MGLKRPAHRYAVLGLGVASELRLPELAPDTAARPADIAIRRGPVRHPPDAPAALAVVGDVTFLRSAAGGFRVQAGADITVDPRPGAEPGEVRDFLLGPVLGIVCHQRALLPLHASAIVAGGGAVAFAGPSGAGKSTLAAHFLARGYAVLSDDVCALDIAAGRPIARPGVQRLKLWPDALQRLGRTPTPGGHDKRRLPTPATNAVSPVPLNRVYLLAEPAADARFEIAPLTGAAAATALMANLFRRQYLAPMGLLAQAFGAATALARAAPVFVLRRSGELAELEREADRLERHFALSPQDASA
jgi:hypothetical protein